MGIFSNEKVKKTISVLLATLSIGGFTGCQKAEQKDIDKETDIKPDKKSEVKSDKNLEEEYQKALEDLGVEVEEETQEVQEEDIISSNDNTYSSKQEKEDDLIHAITGTTERDRLEQVLEIKEWGEEEEELVLYMYDIVERNYDLRDNIYNPKDKQMYLRNTVDIINNIDDLKIDPNDPMLLQNNWKARVRYDNNTIVLKYFNPNDLAHEALGHMDKGTFLNGSCGVDLGYVLEEGRASSKEGDAMEDTQWLDNLDFNLDRTGETRIMIRGLNGSYAAFEEVYISFIDLGIDMESIRREELPVEVYTKQIENELNAKYGDGLGTKYIQSVKEYIGFFNEHAVPVLEQDGQHLIEVRENMLSIHEHCMAQNRDNQVSREVGMER